MADFQWNFDASVRGGNTVKGFLKNLISGTQQATQGQNALAGGFQTAISKINPYTLAIEIGTKALKAFSKTAQQLYQDILKTFAPLERLRNEIKILANLTGEFETETADLLRTIDYLGATTEKTTSEVARMATAMLRSGKTATETAAGLDDVVSASVALGLDAEKAFSVANSTIAKFGKNLGIVVKEGDEVKGVLGLITAGANSANQSFSQLSSALERGNAAGFRALNVSALDAVTAIAALANQGDRGTKAMRHLSSNLLALVQKSEGLKELGVAIADSEGQFLNITDIIQNLNAVLSDKTPIERGQILTKIFGRQQEAMTILLETGVTGFQQLQEKILGATEAIDQLEQAQSRTIIGALARFKSVREAITNTLGELASPLIQEFYNTLTSGLQGFQEQLQAFVDRVLTRFDELREQGVDVATAWLDALVGENFSTLLDNMAEKFAPFVDVLSTLLLGAFRLAWDAFVEIIPEAMQEAATSIRQILWNGIKEIPKLFVQLLKNEVMNIAGIFKRIVEYIPGVNLGGGEETPIETPLTETTPSEQDVEPAKDLTQEQGVIIDNEQEIADLQDQQRKTQLDILKGKRDVAVKTDEIALSESKLTLTLVEQKSAFEKYVLEPWDQFKQRILAVREKFDEMIGKLKGTRISLLERVGLLTGEQATAQREQLQRATFQQTQSRLKLAQSPEERARLQESLAEQAAKLAEQAPEGAGGQFAQQAQEFINASIKSRQEQQAIEERKVAIDKQLALDNVETLKKALPDAQTAGEQVTILQQLGQALQQLGRVDEAATLQAQLQESQRQASGEQVELLKLMLQELKIANEQRVAKSDEQREELRRLREDQGGVQFIDPYLQGAPAV